MDKSTTREWNFDPQILSSTRLAEVSTSTSSVTSDSIRHKLELIRKGLPLPASDVVITDPVSSSAAHAMSIAARKSWADLTEEEVWQQPTGPLSQPSRHSPTADHDLS